MKSKSERVLEILRTNRDKAFDTRTLRKIFNEQYPDHLSYAYLSKIVDRVVKPACLRTPTQLATGYFYTYDREEVIRKIYEEYLFPYPLNRREVFLALIKQEEFESLKEYPSNLKDAHFLALLLGFGLGDGYINYSHNRTVFYFFLESDAFLLQESITEVFSSLHPRIYHRDGAYRLDLWSEKLKKTLLNIGFPPGNRVQRPFLVPFWIYHGEKELKRAFLRGMYGAEGSKPFKGHPRLQFVLSKSDLYLENLLVFLNQLRAMLAFFGIPTTHPQIRIQERRAFHGRFYITGKEDVKKFAEEIGFAYASEKQEVLDALVQTL